MLCQLQAIVRARCYLGQKRRRMGRRFIGGGDCVKCLGKVAVVKNGQNQLDFTSY